MHRLLPRQADPLGRSALAFTFLVSDHFIALHAICVTLWRLPSGRKRLEWTSASHMASRIAARHPRLAAWRDMAASPVLAVLVAGVMIMIAPAALPAAAPVLLLWFVAPEVAIWVSRILPQRPETISAADRKFLRLVAPRTWLFFQHFVRPEDNWLPTDNYQEPPNDETEQIGRAHV